jgi:adenylate kinase family enzyme
VSEASALSDSSRLLSRWSDAKPLEVTVARLVLFGNAGSGKSTYATHLAKVEGLAHLDLDTIVWEGGQVAVQRPEAAIEVDLRRFLDAHSRWVIEGCYSEWVELASRDCTELVFMNPGEAVCLAHCRARPWEPHKFASPAEQDKMLNSLLDWVRRYYTREESCSLGRHQQLFSAFTGSKREVTTALELNRVSR